MKVENYEVDPEITKNFVKKVFTVEQKPLKFVRSVKNSNSVPARVRLTRTSMVENSVYL